MTQALDLAQELIRKRSITPQDAGCQDILSAALKPLGFLVRALPFERRRKLLGKARHTLPMCRFAGHTDVVPPGPLDKWSSDPFTPTLRDGKLYGRGAADMKTSIAAFTVAVESFVRHSPSASGSIALLITSDEEGVARDGTVRVVEALKARGENLDYCLVGEPTSVEVLGDTIKNGRRGSLSANSLQ